MQHFSATTFARQLRREMTDAECRLWFHLRNRALLGMKFRRQYPIGPYFADFVCKEAWLVVEIDGSQHREEVDAPRTDYLRGKGFRVQRFWNHDVLARTALVLEQIALALEEDRRE